MELRRLEDQDDFDFRDPAEDVRGWEVEDSEGNRFGVVVELVADPASGEVRQVILDNGDSYARSQYALGTAGHRIITLQARPATGPSSRQ